MSDVTPSLTRELTHEPTFGDFFALLKPRVMSLVIFTALVGLVAAPGALHPFEGFVALLCIAIGAGASGALNMWWDADIDARMKRTQGRPVPSGRVSAEDARAVGVGLSGFAVVFLGLASNWLAAGLLAFTILYYAVFYTMWLKRATPQNIVIGGAAGALPPVVGWAAATGEVTLTPVLMFLLIFMWTPPHFWALNLFVKGDYGNAGVPMLTETHGRDATRAHVWWYSVALALVAVGIGMTPAGGPVYMAVAVVLNLRFLMLAWRLWRRTDADSDSDSHLVERQLFKTSIWYLFAHFGALLVEAVATRMGVPWV